MGWEQLPHCMGNLEHADDKTQWRLHKETVLGPQRLDIMRYFFFCKMSTCRLSKTLGEKVNL